MRLRRLVLRAKWLPRLQNEEADALTNLDFRHFDPAKRIPVEIDSLKFGVLHELFAEGEAYISELEKARELQKSLAAKLVNNGKGEGRKKRLKRAGDSLREREPW